MSSEVKFAFICRRKWEELSGADSTRRFCMECRHDVINIDAMTESEREELIRAAMAKNERLCVAATLLTTGPTCVPVPPRVAGMLMMPKKP